MCTEEKQDWWDAYVHIAAYAAPLVGKLLENADSHPSEVANFDDWIEELTTIYRALTVVAEDKHCIHERWVKDALELFGKRFTNLWD